MPPTPPQRPSDLESYLRDRVKRGEVTVPPYPAIATQLSRMAADPDVATRALAELVGKDVALAALVLRQAQSAALGGRGPAVLTLEQAVWKVGASELARLAVAASVGASANRRGPLALARRDRWRGALLGALFAQELARRRGIGPEEAFLAGLIHDLGAVVAIAMLEEALATWPALAAELGDLDRLVDAVHVEVGLVVAAKWQLPEVLREIIAFHHEPGASLPMYRPQVALIREVDRICAALATPAGTEALREIAGLDDDERRRIAALLPKVADTMASFGADLAPASPPPIPTRPRPPTDGWPVDVTVEIGRNRAAARGVWLTATSLVAEAATAPPLNWLTDIVIVGGPRPIEVLANVTACDKQPSGKHLATLAPFALDGPIKVAWLELVQSARVARAG